MEKKNLRYLRDLAKINDSIPVKLFQTIDKFSKNYFGGTKDSIMLLIKMVVHMQSRCLTTKYNKKNSKKIFGKK